MNVPLLGVSTGGLTKDRGIKDAVRLVREAGFTAVQLNPRKTPGSLLALRPEDLREFTHVSVHAPVLSYEDIPLVRETLEALRAFHSIRPLDLVVFHPDPIRDFEALRELPFPVGFENMDSRKPSHRTVADMEEVMKIDPRFRFVLDVNHVLTNDKTLALAQDFYRAFGNRLAQVHLSGFATIHDPLFETKQDELIGLIQDFSVPIILEGIGKPEELLPEREYVLRAMESIVRARNAC